MTLTWKQELNLLNDEQLGRIAFASEDSWGFWFDVYTDKCCVMAHIFNRDGCLLDEYRHQLAPEDESVSPLERYHCDAYKFDKKTAMMELIHPEIITEIQNESKRILEERKQRVVSEEPEIVTA